MLAMNPAVKYKSNRNCVGDNVSPPFSWTNVPAGTTSFALVMTDSEGRAASPVLHHWIAYGIPASVTGFAEDAVGKLSSKDVGGKGTAGQGINLGPCTPPNQSPNHYTFILNRHRSRSEGVAARPRPGWSCSRSSTGHVKGSTGIIGSVQEPSRSSGCSTTG